MISGRRCAACKYLRRKCPQNCIFSPYFPSNDPQRFASIHKIYGAKNVAKMLQELPTDRRAQAVNSMYIEAKYRIEDPVYGCVKIISQLHQEIQNVEIQLAKTRAEIAIMSSKSYNINVQDQLVHHNNDIDGQQLIEALESDLSLIVQGQQSSNNIYYIEQSQSNPSNNQAPRI